MDKDGKVVPGLAEKYEVSDDQLTWTFQQRRLKVVLTVQLLQPNDFVYSWQKLDLIECCCTICTDSAWYGGRL